MINLIDFYKDVLQFANLHADEKGYVRSNGGEKSIITVQNRFLVIPIREQLRHLGPDKEVFHPLSEDTLSRMSEALGTYIYRLNGCLNTRFAETVWELKKFCTSPKKQQSLTPVQLGIIRNVQGEEETKEDNSFERFLAQQISKNPSSAFLTITMARGAVFKGQKKSRVGFVTFPLYRRIKEDLDKPRKDSEFEGLSKKNLEMLLQLYEAIFPGLDISEEYGYGFDTGIAPWFTTLMRTASGVADALNVVTEAFEADFSSDDFEPLNMKWKPTLDNPTEMQRLSRMVQNLEIDPVSVDAPAASAPAAPAVITPAVATPSPTGVPFMGGAAPAGPYRPTPAAAPGGFARPAEQQKGRPRIPFDQWKNQNSAPSPLGATGAIMEAIRRYNEGYTNFYMTHVQQYGVPPAGMPNPQQLVPNVPAPPYPGCPQLPMVPGVTMPMQAPGFGQQPMYGQQQMPPGFVQTPQGWVQAQPQQMMYNQPVQMQPAQQGWGQGWGQPMQPQYQQPQYQNNQGFNAAQNTHTGTVFPGAL